jgi:hypothetical protein
MKPALVDTDILSEFLRGTTNVVENAERYLQRLMTLLILAAKML